MSPEWNNILKTEEKSSVCLMINSVDCMIKLIHQIKFKFKNLFDIWKVFCIAISDVIGDYCKYLSEFKEVYLSPEIRSQTHNLQFRSPWVVALILK